MIGHDFGLWSDRVTVEQHSIGDNYGDADVMDIDYHVCRNN